MSAAAASGKARMPARGAPLPGIGPLAGTGPLIRLILRRDRMRLSLWALGLVAMRAGLVEFLKDAFATDEDIAARTAVVEGNPAGILFTGPGYGLEDASVDNYGPLAHELGATMIILFALMGLFLTVRYTRAEEEEGRAELVRAARVGRQAPLTAALLVTTGLQLLVGVLVALGLGAQDLEWEGAWAFGIGIALLGVVVCAIAALCAQVAETGRGAAGLAGAVFSVLFVLRAIGDIQDNGLTWASPVGWAQGLRPFADEQWWPALYLGGLAVLLAAVAYLLNGRRDLGSALFLVRPGRPGAGVLLSGPLGIAARLQRAVLLAWTLAMVAVGGGMGGLLAGEAEALAEMEVFRQFLIIQPDADATEQILGFYLLFLALLAACYSIQSILRAPAEETAGRAEPVLARPVARWRWAGGHLLLSLLGTAGTLAATGFALGVGVAAETGDIEAVGTYTLAVLGYLPALAVLTGLAFAAFGILPRLVWLPWALLGYAFLVAMFGLPLGLADWAMNLSPFTHIPEVPAEDYAAAPALWLGGFALALTAVGFAGLTRRDLRSP